MSTTPVSRRVALAVGVGKHPVEIHVGRVENAIEGITSDSIDPLNVCRS